MLRLSSINSSPFFPVTRAKNMCNASHDTKQVQRNTLNSDLDQTFIASSLKTQPWSLVLYHLAQYSQRKKDNSSIKSTSSHTYSIFREWWFSRASCYPYDLIPYTNEQSNTHKDLDFQTRKWKAVAITTEILQNKTDSKVNILNKSTHCSDC